MHCICNVKNIIIKITFLFHYFIFYVLILIFIYFQNDNNDAESCTNADTSVKAEDKCSKVKYSCHARKVLVSMFKITILYSFSHFTHKNYTLI